MNQENESLKNSCEKALEALAKLKDPNFTDIQSKLEWCLGSYDHDKNPAGLHEYGTKSLEVLKTLKEQQPRKVAKKVIDDLENAISNYSHR